MAPRTSRRDAPRAGAALAGLAMFGVPDWLMPVLAQGDEIIPFADMPATTDGGRGGAAPAAASERRSYDVRKIDGPFTPADEFFTVQHLGHPVIDPTTFRLGVSGLVARPQSLSLADLRSIGAAELIAGFECSGNRRPTQGLSSNGRWTGMPLRAVLDRAGVDDAAREVVFFGADRGEAEVAFRAQNYILEQQFGRSLPRDKALSADPFLAWALNGEPLTRHQGSPLRLIVPGWYGVANVKWLAGIHAQADQYLGNYQARWYRTVKGEMIDGEMKWVETAITRMRLKSFIARVSRRGTQYTVLAVALNDGTPLRSLEIKVDDGPWQTATPDPATSSQYSWKLYTFAWTGVTPGEHTLVSRATDVNGQVQPTVEDLVNKRSFLEDNSQHPRTLTIAQS